MSYVNSIKDLLKPDLKALIHNITGFEESSPEFVEIEEKLWLTILNHNSVSITDVTVEKTIHEFVQKFLFHGFHVKAQNLKLLIDHYSKLPYFKKYCSAVVKWGMIDVLIKLSYKPTSAINDDLPLDLNKLKQIPVDNEIDQIDWESYLKEGLENFVLPESDDDSWSLENDDINEENQATSEQLLENNVSVSLPTLSLFEERKDNDDNGTVDKERRSEEHTAWINKNFQKPYWDDPNIREIPPSKSIHATWCFMWEDYQRKAGIEVENTRIISEHKVLRELVCIFYLPPDPPGSFLVETTNDGGYAPAPRVSVSFLEPPTFAEILKRYVCPYLTYINELQTFVHKIPKDSNAPFTYLTYSSAIGDILGKYAEVLKEIEARIKAQKTIITIRSFLHEIKGWLRRLEFIYEIHRKAVYENYSTEDNWKCSLRLLSVLYNEIVRFESWQKVIVVGLFLRSFRTYLKILDNMFTYSQFDHKNEFIIICRIKDVELGEGILQYSDLYPPIEDIGDLLDDPVNEFIFSRSESVYRVEIREEYVEFLTSIGGQCLDLWKPFFDLCLRALSSVHFLSNLDKTVNDLNRPSIYDLFYNGLMEIMKFLILQLHPDFKTTEPKVPEPPEWMFPLKGKDSFSSKIAMRGLKTIPLVKHTTYDLMEEVFDIYRKPSEMKPNETLFDCFLTDLEQCDILLVDVHYCIRNSLFTAVELSFAPKGLITNILLNKHRLLDLLQNLWKVIFVRIPSLVPAILNKISGVSTTPGNLCTAVRECLVDHIPPQMISRFNLVMSDLPTSILSNNVLEIIEYLSIEYRVEPQLKLIITEDMFSEYSQLFRFYLQLKFAYKTLHKLRFGVFDADTERARRLFSLRMWFLHTISAFNTYFLTLDEQIFLNKIKQLSEETTDLYAFQKAHYKFIRQCKVHCFFFNKILIKLILRLFKFCEILLKLWFLEEKSLLKITEIENLEKDYLDVMSSLALQIEMIFMKNSYFQYNIPFEMLHDQIIHNIPATWD